MRELLAHNGHELLDLIEAGELQAAELGHSQAEFAREVNARLESFLSWNDSRPVSGAWELAPEGAARGFKHLPYAAKDIFCTRGLQTTAGSSILAGYAPPYDATIISQLVLAGQDQHG
jgi:aspartyl-tRNA(Asn)/glutamyl-tRNA(Gln) amidotransferase subunit A